MPPPAAFSLDGRRAMVTGGGRGLGAAMGLALAHAGARVALISRNAAELQEAADLAPTTIAIPADVSNIDALPELVDTVEESLDGPVDIVLHAAGTQHHQSAEEFERGAWDSVLAVNLTAPFFLSQEIGRRQLHLGRPGSHIFVCSLTSLLSVAGIAAYAASKSGLYGVLRALSTEWSGQGIRANGIGPGYFRTELTKALVDDPIRGPKLLDRIPMGRLGDPDDLAGAVVFLSSDAAGYITGQLLMVDGGWTAS